MQAFTFIHAADLHLDATLPGPADKIMPGGSEKKQIKAMLSGATLEALERLTDLCIREQAAFLLLSGDVFHRMGASLASHYALRNACEKLSQAGIQVFWARGNHDSAASGPLPLKYPDSIHIFGTDAENVAVEKNGAAIAIISGASHAGQREKNNLAALLASKGKSGIFQIGLLHCAVLGNNGRHETYAPCALDDLQNMHYWALGHVHTQAILRQEPPAAYSGSLQGLHINENGPHGCFVVRVDETGRAQLSFTPIAPVQWEKLPIDISQLQESGDNESLLDMLEEKILQHLASFVHLAVNKNTNATLPYPLRGLIIRLVLTGRSNLDSFLRQGDNLDDFHLRLNQSLASFHNSEAGSLKICIKDISLNTGPNIDIEAIMQGDNLLGETLRKAHEFSSAATSLAQNTGTEADSEIFEDVMNDLGKLYENSRFKRYMKNPDEAELAELARQAASLCLNLFEVE